MKISEAIRFYRDQCNMTQLDLDIEAGLRPNTIQRYERLHGLTRGPQYEAVTKIIKAFKEKLGDGFDYEVFFGFTEVESLDSPQ